MENTFQEHDKLVESIFRKVEVTKIQTSERSQEQIRDNVNTRMQRVFNKVFNIYQNPSLPQETKDIIKRQFSETLDLIVMHSNSEVINALTNNLITEKFKKKVMEN